jgi:hypothetical protein
VILFQKNIAAVPWNIPRLPHKHPVPFMVTFLHIRRYITREIETVLFNNQRMNKRNNRENSVKPFYVWNSPETTLRNLSVQTTRSLPQLLTLFVYILLEFCLESSFLWKLSCHKVL